MVTAQTPLLLDLRAARVLCADESPQGLDIVCQILMGFGVQHMSRATTSIEFRHDLQSQPFDLVLIEAGLADNGFEQVRWVRRESGDLNRHVAIIVISGHTPADQVEMARDCGANYTILKPLSAEVLLRRIVWIGRSGRDFINADTYVGPDRRVRNLGVPPGMTGRREGDLSARIGDATDPNMSQDQIDDLMRPRRATL